MLAMTANLVVLPITPVYGDSTVASATLRDIRGPIDTGGLPPFAMTAAVLLLLAAGYLFLLRSRSRPLLTATADKPPPSDCRQSLATLIAEYRLGACGGSEAILELDAIVRRAAGEAARFLTTAELRAVLGDRAGNDLDGLLAVLDEVKFAGRRPSPADVECALKVAGPLLEALA